MLQGEKRGWGVAGGCTQAGGEGGGEGGEDWQAVKVIECGEGDEEVGAEERERAAKKKNKSASQH